MGRSREAKVALRRFSEGGQIISLLQRPFRRERYLIPHSAFIRLP